VWAFVGNTPLQNRWRKSEQIPSFTQASTAMSKSLKKAGFRFVGPTICYAFMQSAGLVNDHLLHCPSHQRCADQAAAWET
jgi:DNA-3-methyladenine glycosylase I